MKFEDFISARKYAQEKQKEAAERIPMEESPDSETAESAFEQRTEFTPDEIDYFIGLQVKSWGVDKPQDYRKYAREVWREIVQEEPEAHPEQFHEFENRMIVGLHRMESRQFVYPEVQQSMRDLIEKYGAAVKKIILWSTGDVTSTGYQVAKVSRSRIISDFLKGALAVFPKDAAHDFFRKKTSYMVDDDKFGRLVQYVKDHLAEQPGEALKLVIIEDTRTNIQKASDAIRREVGGKIAERVTIIPIWAAYSRYGRIGQERARREGSHGRFLQTKRTFNGIDSFAELGNKQRFRSNLKNAHVFIDFDGVILDDDARREAQVISVYNALVQAAAATGISEEALYARVHQLARTTSRPRGE